MTPFTLLTLPIVQVIRGDRRESFLVAIASRNAARRHYRVDCYRMFLETAHHYLLVLSVSGHLGRGRRGD